VKLMAEGEKQEKRVFEMNIWFIVLLLVIIVSCTWIFTLNSKLSVASKSLADAQATITRLEKRGEEKTQTITALVKKVSEGSINNNELIADLNSMLEEKDAIIESLTNPAPEGEVEEVVEEQPAE
jgi:peptidoglycan hydrolase CwlO-like protein